MKAIVRKWGNSLGIRIPSHMAKDLSLENGSSVNIIEEDNRIIIQRIIIQPKNNKNLQDILALITEENIHTEQFSPRAGKEIL